MSKPPIGLKPKYIHMAQRVTDIFEAMERYSEAHLPIPPEWVDELKGLVGTYYEFVAHESWEDR